MNGTGALRLFALVVLAGAVGACTHVRGVVLAARTEKPIPRAEFTVGRPDMMVLNRYHADSAGRFDFYIAPMDETNLYVWDHQGDPSVSVRHIERLEISDHMTIHLAPPESMFGP